MKTILVDAVGCFISNGKINKEMQELLDTYPNKKVILTNAYEQDFKNLGLDNVPYQVFTLNHNPEKTDISYYEKALALLELDEDDVVYFEHNAEAVDTALSVGINTHHYKKLNVLKKFLDKNL